MPDDGQALVSLAAVVERLESRSFGLVLLVTALPAWIPVLPPPVRSIFGLPIGLVAGQMLNRAGFPGGPDT